MAKYQQRTCLHEKYISPFTWQKIPSDGWKLREQRKNRFSKERQRQKIYLTACVVDNRIIMVALICFGMISSEIPVANKIISRTTRCSEFINRNFDLTTYSLTLPTYNASLIVLPLFSWRGSVLLHYVCFFRSLALFEQQHQTGCEVPNHFTLRRFNSEIHTSSEFPSVWKSGFCCKSSSFEFLSGFNGSRSNLPTHIFKSVMTTLIQPCILIVVKK